MAPLFSTSWCSVFVQQLNSKHSSYFKHSKGNIIFYCFARSQKRFQSNNFTNFLKFAGQLRIFWFVYIINALYYFTVRKKTKKQIHKYFFLYGRQPIRHETTSDKITVCSVCRWVCVCVFTALRRLTSFTLNHKQISLALTHHFPPTWLTTQVPSPSHAQQRRPTWILFI